MFETPHIKANIDDFSSTVIMPGDPMRAKFIAETYLDDYKLINSVRGMLAYTGYYKGKRVTVMASGMGMPSMGIYCYELFTYYHVKNIIRIGSAGSMNPDVHVLDIVLSEESYNEGSFAYTFNNDDCHNAFPSKSLNEKIIKKAKENNIQLKVGRTICSEVFDLYMKNSEEFLNRIPSAYAVEMEAFALFYIAKTLNKNASCLLTISDSRFQNNQISADERQTSLTTMIELALDTAIEEDL